MVVVVVVVAVVVVIVVFAFVVDGAAAAGIPLGTWKPQNSFKDHLIQDGTFSAF